MGAAWFISWQRPPWSYTINWCHVSRCCRPKQLMSMLSTCHSACIQQQAYALSWLQWAATVWMHVMLSLKDSRHGLSSIYSFFFSTSRKAQHSALLAVLRSSTETHSEISAHADSAWTLFFSSSSLHAVTLLSASMFAAFFCGDVALCFDVRNGGGNDTCKRWDCDESSKCKRTLLSSNSRRCLHDWGWVLSDCEWVLKSQKVYISWCRWLHKYFCWQWHICFVFLWPQDRKWHFPGWPCFSSVNDFVISFVEQTQVLVIAASFLLRCFSCTRFSECVRRDKHCSCSSIEGHQWLHRSKTAHACTHLCKGSIGRSRCECTTRTLLLFAGVEQKPHVQTKLDNLLVLQSLLKCRKILCFSESLKQSCLNFPLSGFHAWIFLSQVFMPEFSSLGFHYRCDC